MALVKKKVLMLGSKDIDTINSSDICDTYKDLYLSEKEREERLLQGIQLANGLKFYNPSIKKILITINGMPQQLFAAGLWARDIYSELKKYFYREHSNVTWEEFLTTKFGLWIDTRSSTDNALHGSGRVVEKPGILLQTEKVPETSNVDLTCHVFSLEDAVAHLSVTNPSGILTIEK